MAINEYRRHAAYCVSIADNAVNLENKLSLLGLAEAWLELARRAERAELNPPLNHGLPLGAATATVSTISGRA